MFSDPKKQSDKQKDIIRKKSQTLSYMYVCMYILNIRGMCTERKSLAKESCFPPKQS